MVSTNTKLAEALRLYLNAYQAHDQAAAIRAADKAAREALAAHDAEQAQEPNAESQAAHDNAILEKGIQIGRTRERQLWEHRAAQAVPAGWKLVPPEATPAMHDAYSRVLAVGSELDGAMVWAAMLAAAPAAPAPEAKPQCLWPARGSCLAWRQAAPDSERLVAAPQAQAAGQELADLFESWWSKHGQFCRSGGGDYEKSFAWAAWNAALAQRQPLTDEQIEDVFFDMGQFAKVDLKAFARAIERAHGIGAAKGDSDV